MSIGITFIALSVGAGAVALTVLKSPSGKKVETAFKALSTIAAVFVMLHIFMHSKQIAGLGIPMTLLLFFVLFQGVHNNLRDIERNF